MPNLLAHIAVHGLSTRALISGADLRWIYLGAIIPDLPWILRRALVGILGLQDDNLQIMLTAVVQSTLTACLLLCGALALLDRRPGRTFGILALGSLTHLLLDASQDKIGNGVLLLAPFSWELTSFQLFGVESWLSYLLTVSGLAYLLFKLPEALRAPLELRLSPKLMLIASALLCTYLLVPIALRGAVYEAEVKSYKLLYGDAPRVGQRIGLDRENYLVTDEGTFVKWNVGKQLAVEKLSGEQSGSISGWAHFVEQDRIRFESYQIHPKGLRDWSSIVGLLLVTGIWLGAWTSTLRRSKRS